MSSKNNQIIELSEILEKFPNACSKFVKYEKSSHNTLMGLELNKGFIHKSEGHMNQFSKKEIKIPNDYKKKTVNQKWKKEFYCNPNKTRITFNNPEFKKLTDTVKGFKKYYIHDNGGRPFLVYVGKDETYIYKIPEDRYFVEKDYFNNKRYQLYVEPVANFKTLKTFIGKSPLTDSTSFSGGHGPAFDGNTILLQTGQNQYVFIGERIYQFETDDDKILKYYSPVGNSDVPYPVALGEKFIYFMLDQVYVPIEYVKKLPLEEKIDAYSYFYGHVGNQPLSKFSKKMKEIKSIQQRIW